MWDRLIVPSTMQEKLHWQYSHHCSQACPWRNIIKLQVSSSFSTFTIEVVACLYAGLACSWSRRCWVLVQSILCAAATRCWILLALLICLSSCSTCEHHMHMSTSVRTHSIWYIASLLLSLYNTTKAQTLAIAAVGNTPLMPLTNNLINFSFSSIANIRTSSAYNSVQIGILHIPTASFSSVIYREKSRGDKMHTLASTHLTLQMVHCVLRYHLHLTAQVGTSRLIHNWTAERPAPLFPFLQAHPQLSSINSIIGLPKINNWQTSTIYCHCFDLWYWSALSQGLEV